LKVFKTGSNKGNGFQQGRRGKVLINDEQLNAPLEIKGKEQQEHASKNYRQQDLDELTYIISHDLQEPLRMITSYVQLLNKRYGDKLDDNARDYIKYAVDGSNRLKQMMDDLLTYSRIGKPSLNTADVDPAELVEKVKKSLKVKYPGKEYTIEFAAEKQMKIRADKDLLIKLIYNLLDNSVKFNNNNKQQIRISLADAEDEWILSFTDNGLGIEKEYHGKVFGIFQKLHNHEEYPGSGIGLAICEKIAKNHGGRIWIDSVLNEGSTFHVSIKKAIKQE
jgi:light-regulated signal transduction histidine kinase (bacteriophytochrome)